ncbi:hypothetical protein ACFQY0_17615 [Haloferula chungangensis]|uniref:FecR protein domain-containing protein n=1 Tax=Haloferula chungangensis TaxID=1048331 RepID=A0ABW2L9B2_9BACT
MNEDHTRNLVHRYFDHSLEPGEKEQLEGLLLSSKDARVAFRREARIHGLLSVAAEMDKGRAAAICDPVIPSNRSFPASDGSTKRRSRNTWLTAGLASAASIAIFFSVTHFRSDNGATTVAEIPSPGLASITSNSLIEWAATSSEPRGTEIDAGLYQIEFGSLRLHMGGGALVSIAAPCEFEIVSNKRIDVKYGKLTARLPHPKDELVVTMPGLTLTDLGTGFGINVGSSGEALVSVFEGKVKLEEEEEGSESTILSAGSSIRHNPVSGNEVIPLKFQTSQFTDLWPLTLGIDEASSLIHFLPPGPKYPPLNHYSDIDHLFLVPERQTFKLKRPLLLDLGKDINTWPGENPDPKYRPRIPLGTRVSSYLVFYNPPPTEDEGDVRSISGELTFDRKIIGVICTNRTLIPSNPILGMENQYFQPLLQPSEARDSIEGILPHDSFRLSSDLRSIHFNLNVTRGIDSFRIILGDS